MLPKNVNVVNETMTTLKEQLRFNKISKQECYEICQKVIMTTDIERKQNAEVLTPLTLVNEMMSKIPEDAWTDLSSGKLPTIFDPCVGKGAFVVVIYDLLWVKLKDLIPDEEERRVTILEEIIYFADINPFNIHVTKIILDPANKYKLNSYTGDTLEMDIESTFDIEKFDIIVGNPPYDNGGRPARPLYDKFYLQYEKKCKILSYIIPSRWLCGGMGVANFRQHMFSSTHIQLIKHYDSSFDIFGNSVDIKGGVMYVVYNESYSGNPSFNGTIMPLDKYDIFVDIKYHSILDKVLSQKMNTLDTICSMGGSYSKVKTNDTRLCAGQLTTHLKCYVSKQKGHVKYIDKKHFTPQMLIKFNNWKVITARAAYGSRSGFNLNNLHVCAPMVIASHSYTVFSCKHENEANILHHNLQLKLINFLLSLRKITQDITPVVCSWIPMLMTKKWDNEKIYKYFNLTQQEIKIIEKNVK
jgi:hypothetical protein